MSSKLLICSMIILLSFISTMNAIPPYYTGSSTMYMPLYSRRLNLHSGLYGTGYSSSLLSSPYSHGGSYGSRYGQGFVGNPGIGIRQSGATLANVYPQMSTSSSSSYGQQFTASSSSLYGLSTPTLYGGSSPSYSSMMLPPPPPPAVTSYSSLPLHSYYG